MCLRIYGFLNISILVIYCAPHTHHSNVLDVGVYLYVMLSYFILAWDDPRVDVPVGQFHVYLYYQLRYIIASSRTC